MSALASTERSRGLIWVGHAWLPLVVFMGIASLFATTRLDLTTARALFFDASGPGWIGAHSWFVNELIHTGGRWAVRLVAVLAFVLWALSFCIDDVRDWRRSAGYFLSALILTVGVVGLLKTVTNVDCPWDLGEFGGRFPYVDLFSSRSGELPRARCFPAAHASSGYAFMALYFVAYERSRSLARMGLASGLLLGLIFGIAQQSRGAHFVSHDLWSAFFGWMIPLTLYVFGFGGRLYARSQRSALHGSRAPEPCSRRPAWPRWRRKARASSSECRLETCSTTCGRKD